MERKKNQINLRFYWALKIINYITNVKNLKKLKTINGQLESFQIYQFCDGDINKFVLLLRKGVYPYEYMDSWKRFDETSLPDKKRFLQ